MSASVLGHLTLGYQLVWNRLRHPVAVMLFVERLEGAAVDAHNLLATLSQAWSGRSPKLILCVQSPELLFDLLQNAPPDGPWIAVQEDYLALPSAVERVRAAHVRGLTLLWRGRAEHGAGAEIQDFFALRVVTADPAKAPPGADADQIVESVPHVELVERYLDKQGALGVAGWPLDSVLQSYGHRIEPNKNSIDQLMVETDDDVPLEVIEQTLSEEPVLVYRFLLHANSAARGLRDVDSLRHALMLLGLSNFKRWLEEQLALASSDLNLLPVRSSLVVRARLTEQLLDAGEDDELRSEVYLCGLMSQIDKVLGEPLATALHRFPLSERIISAVLGKSGPYAPYLALAGALEYGNMHQVPALCETCEIDIADVNRVLLRVLAHPQYQPPNSLFPVSRIDSR